MLLQKIVLVKKKLRWRKKNGEKRGRAKIPSPQPPSFLPARAEIFKNLRQDFLENEF